MSSNLIKHAFLTMVFLVVIELVHGVGQLDAIIKPIPSYQLKHNDILATLKIHPGKDSIDARYTRGGAKAKVAPVVTTKPSNLISLSQKGAVLLGIAMAFNTGYMNGFALSGTIANMKQPSVAVTGAWTQSAIGFASGNMDQFITNTRMIVSYVVGSFLSSLIHPKPKTFTLSRKDTVVSFYIGAVIMFLADNFARKSTIESAKVAFNLVAVASGMQNSFTSVYTSNLVRSSHFSGITSDMGTFLGQAIRGNYDNVFKLKAFAALAASFWIGSLAAVFASNILADKSFIVNGLLYLLLGTGVLFA